MQSKAKTVEEYLASLPDDRREALEAVRSVILKNLGKGFEEGMQYGMIGYFVPHSIFPDGYHCAPEQPLPFAALGSQKNHMAVYLMSLYGMEGHEAWFREEWAKTGKRLDMGKSCVRFKKLEDLPLALIGKAIKKAPLEKYVEYYVSTRPAAKGSSAGRKAAAKKTTKKKATKRR